MNPSYNGSFGDTNSSGVNPGVSGVPMGMDNGDIILVNNEKKKPKKSTILLIVGLILLAIVIGATVAKMLNGGQSGSDLISASDIQKAFNSYVNYVMWGKDSDEGFDISSINNQTPFFIRLEDEAKTNYLENANAKYTKFADLYYENNGIDNITAMEVYFQDFAKIDELSQEDIIVNYIDNSETITTEMIERHYGAVSNITISIYNYLQELISLDKQELGVIVAANKAGCVVDREIVNGCYKETEEQSSTIETLKQSISEQKKSFHSEAFSVLSSIYEENYAKEGAS